MSVRAYSIPNLRAQGEEGQKKAPDQGQLVEG